MAFSIGYHPRFDELIPPWRPIVGPTTLVSAKMERMGPISTRRYLDIVLRSDAGLHPLLLIEVEAGAARLPEALRVAGDLPERVIGAIAGWIEERLAAEGANLTIFENATDIVAIAQQPDGPAIPGLISYGRLFDICDRYRSVKAYASGRRVLDLGPGSGFGLHLLAECATSVRRAGAAAADVDRALGVERAAAGERGDLVLALGLEPLAAAEALRHARERCTADGIAILSVREPGGTAALEALGLAAAPLKRVAGDVLPPLAEAIAVVSVPPVADARVAAVESRGPIEVAPRPLRILFPLRPSAAAMFGGDVVQVRNTAAALVRRGHDAVVSLDRQIDATGFDIVHFSNMTSVFETLDQLRGAASFAGPIVMMPIFTDHADETSFAIRVQPTLFAAPPDSAGVEATLAAFADRRMVAEVEFMNRPVSQIERLDMAPNYTSAQREIARRIDFAIANAHAEMHRFYRYVDPTVPYAIAPSAIDPALYHPAAGDAFRARYRLGEFVLVTGRIEPRKNHLMLLYALRASGRNVVIIGRNDEAVYGGLVRSYLGRRAFVFGHMPEAELAGAIAAARVLAMPSYDEVVSLSSLNGAACETSLVLTRQSYEHEYFRDDAEYCDPLDHRSIADAVERAWSTHDQRAERRRELGARVRREYTWDRSAEATERAYYRVLASNPRGNARLAAAR